MIFRFIVLKRLHWNDLQFFYFLKKIKYFFLTFRISPDSYSQNMMTWRKYDFVPDSYSQNMMTWHKYDFVPLIYVGSAAPPIYYLLAQKFSRAYGDAAEFRSMFFNMDELISNPNNYPLGL